MKANIMSTLSLATLYPLLSFTQLILLNPYKNFLLLSSQIKKEYESGVMLTGELKKEAVDAIAPWIQAYQQRRAKVTDEIVESFFKIRPIKL